MASPKQCRALEWQVLPNGCWQVTSHLPSGNGYVLIRLAVGQKQIYVHRHVYAQHVGPLVPGLFVMHLCDNKLCVNPAHLQQGTNAENMQAAARNGLMKREGTKSAKLTAQQVLAIRADTRFAPDIARDYGISNRTVSSIKCMKTWRWLKSPMPFRHPKHITKATYEKRTDDAHEAA